MGQIGIIAHALTPDAGADLGDRLGIASAGAVAQACNR